MGLNDAARGPAITFVDRSKQDEMLTKLADMGRTAHDGARALLAHVEGTRAQRGGQPVTTISAVWFDLAVRFGLTIVPLRFCGGLPRTGVTERQEFPVGFGGQELIIGRPIDGALLAALRLKERREHVLAGLAELEAFESEPVGDAEFAACVSRAQRRWELDELRAVFLLLKARTEAWPLDDDGLPVALPVADVTDAFWGWFADTAVTHGG